MMRTFHISKHLHLFTKGLSILTKVINKFKHTSVHACVGELTQFVGLLLINLTVVHDKTSELPQCCLVFLLSVRTIEPQHCKEKRYVDDT